MSEKLEGCTCGHPTAPLMPSTIAAWTQYIMNWCERKGWNKNPDGSSLVLGNMVSNLHSEISEAWEEIRNGKAPEEILVGVNDPTVKPEGFPIELADLAIRLFHLCGYFEINLEEMIALKMKYNEIREWRHGGKTA